MKNASECPQSSRRRVTGYPTTPPRAPREAPGDGEARGSFWEIVAFLILVLLFSLFFDGCSTTCPELAEKAARRGCPERVIEKTVQVYEPIELGEIPEAPPLTSAEFEPEEAAGAVQAALEALIRDLAETRRWGWELYHKLEALKAEQGSGGE